MDANFRNRRIGLPAILLATAAALFVGAGCGTTGQRNLTIFLEEYSGRGAEAAAEDIRAQMTRSGFADVFVIRSIDTDTATVCIGHFGSADESAALKILKRLKDVRDEAGRPIYYKSKVVPIPENQPKNPWPLESAPDKRYFSLQVAAWRGPGFMVKAQAYAEQLRQEGYEAYIHYTPDISMVTIGAFGMDVFENPSVYGRIGVKPKIVSPAVLELMKRFPCQRVDGVVTQPNENQPSLLVEIPGRTPPVVRTSSSDQYEISIVLVDAKKGTFDRQNAAIGVAKNRNDIPGLVVALARQAGASLPAGRVRIGIAGVQPMNTMAARDKADAAILSVLPAALQQMGTRFVIVSAEETRRVLEAEGKSPEDILLDPRMAKDVKALDYICIANVTYTR
jgi:hypothetical protein